MDLLKETRFVERLQFFNGQRLFASDLQGIEAFNREMRWLHNKSLHQPGIGNGFAVSGRSGDRQVTIDAGYAIDALGREIVLLETHTEPVPPVAGEEDGTPTLFDLTVSYPDDADLEESELREGVCGSQGAVRLKEEPVFCWVRLDPNGQPIDPKLKQDILAGTRLVLARAEVLNCQLNKDLSLSPRLSARPPRQPYIFCAKVEPTHWRPWYLSDDVRDAVNADDVARLINVLAGTFVIPVILPIGLTAAVDTSAAGFLTTPAYFARVEGGRVKEYEITLTDDSGNQSKLRFNFVADGLIEVSDPMPGQFNANVLLMVQVVFPVQRETGGEERLLSLLKSTSAAFRSFVEKAQVLPENADELKKKIEELIEHFFSDWTLVWMGVEG